MSDGASAPAVVRHLLDLDHPHYRPVWTEHDRLYYVGGAEEDRLFADADMLTRLLAVDMPWHDAEQVYDAVRAWGRAHFHYHDAAAPSAAEAP